MTTYTFPTGLIPQEMALRFRALNKVFRPSPNWIQTDVRRGSYLVFDLTYRNLTVAQRSALQAFIAKLDGQNHRLQVPYYGHVNRGTLGGSPVVNGGGQIGALIATTGWTAGQTVLLRGDMVGIGGELKIVTDDVTADGSGNAALPIQPMQRVAPGNGSAVVVTDPVGTFILEQPENAVGSFVQPDIRFGQASFAIAEVVTQP